MLGKLPVPGRPTIWITVGQGPTALAVGAGGGCLDIFTLIYPFSPLSPSLWETARYRLKYCLKGPLNPKPTNQPTNILCDIMPMVISVLFRPVFMFAPNLSQPFSVSNHLCLAVAGPVPVLPSSCFTASLLVSWVLNLLRCEFNPGRNL